MKKLLFNNSKKAKYFLKSISKQSRQLSLTLLVNHTARDSLLDVVLYSLINFQEELLLVILEEMFHSYQSQINMTIQVFSKFLLS